MFIKPLHWACTLSSPVISYIQSLLGLLGATTAFAGNLCVLPEHAGPHHVYIAMQLAQDTCKDAGCCVEIDQKVRSSTVSLVVFADLVGQKSFPKVFQVPHHGASLHQSLHNPPDSRRRLWPLHRLQDHRQFVARHGVVEEILDSHS